jgi:hypothetical protein
MRHSLALVAGSLNPWNVLAQLFGIVECQLFPRVGQYRIPRGWISARLSWRRSALSDRHHQTLTLLALTGCEQNCTTPACEQPVLLTDDGALPQLSSTRTPMQTSWQSANWMTRCEPRRRLREPTSPQGQKRILSIESPMVYRIRVSGSRGATWVDEAPAILWLCAARRREEGSEDDAFEWFAQLHASGRLLPVDDDYLRDRAEAAARLWRALTSELLGLLAAAREARGQEVRSNLGEWLPARVLALAAEGIEEIWCALSIVAVDGSGTPHQLRDVLFAELEHALQPAVAEVRADWPGGIASWEEVVRLYLREEA